MDTLPVLDLAQYAGNDVPFVVTVSSTNPGPHVMVSAIVHGNEPCGAHVLDQLIREDIQPCRGRISFCFANVAAYATHDPKDSLTGRKVDLDLNRIWSDEILKTEHSASEVRRALEILPVLETVDFVLDLHSMNMESPPMIIAAEHHKDLALATLLSSVGYIVIDQTSGADYRLTGFGRFSQAGSIAAGILLECGFHQSWQSVDVARNATLDFFHGTGVLAQEVLKQHGWVTTPTPMQVTLLATDRVTNQNEQLVFDFEPIDMFPVQKSGTVIAHDGDLTISTPYDDCFVVNPNRRNQRGTIACRFARRLENNGDNSIGCGG